jgi:hypothetical protein
MVTGSGASVLNHERAGARNSGRSGRRVLRGLVWRRRGSPWPSFCLSCARRTTPDTAPRVPPARATSRPRGIRGALLLLEERDQLAREADVGGGGEHAQAVLRLLADVERVDELDELGLADAAAAGELLE